MFKLFLILALCNILTAQKFKCEFPCPQNAECTADERCSCNHGYKAAISEYDGLPYCQWKGTMTTKLTVETENKSSININHLVHDDDLVDDNGELFGDYRHQRDQPAKEEIIAAEVNDKVTQQFKESSKKSATFKPEHDTKTLSYFKPKFLDEYSTPEPIITTEFVTAAKSPETTADIVLYKDIVSHEENASTTTTGYEDKVSADVSTFYNLLAIFCMFLAFLFVLTAMYGCVKL